MNEDIPVAPVVLSGHGKTRCKQRLGIPLRAVQRNVEQALEFGMNPEQFTGYTRKYMEARLDGDGREGDTVKYWQGHVYVFFKNTLITVFVPGKTAAPEAEKQSRKFYLGEG